MGGTVVCPWCDCGKKRDGTKWTWEDSSRAFALFQEELGQARRTHSNPDDMTLPAKCARCDAPVRLEFNPLRWVDVGKTREHRCPRKLRRA